MLEKKIKLGVFAATLMKLAFIYINFIRSGPLLSCPLDKMPCFVFPDTLDFARNSLTEANLDFLLSDRI